jgi:ubiquitin-like protein Pup
MAEREQIRKTPERRQEPSEVEEPSTSGAAAERADKLKSDLDDILDEIDEVLEDNAEEFVRNYVQKGGQ